MRLTRPPNTNCLDATLRFGSFQGKLLAREIKVYSHILLNSILQPVPEPSSIALFAIGALGGLLALRRRA